MNEQEPSLRLFVALDLPAFLRDRLARLQMPASGVRWVPPTQLHLTLHFIPSLPTAHVPQLVQELNRIRQAPFELMLQGVGQFPRLGRARVIYAAVHPAEPVIAIWSKVETCLTACSIPVDTRAFSPHVTLARLKHASCGFAQELLRAQRGLSSPPFVISEFVLYASELSAHGVQHKALQRFPLTETELGDRV